MRTRSVQKLIEAVAKLAGNTKVTGKLFIDVLKKSHITYAIGNGNHKTLKHQAAITAINHGWDEKTALVLWVAYPPPEPPDPNDPFAVAMASMPQDPDRCLYIVIPDTTFNDVAEKIAQIAKLKAFL